ncbi:MAG: alanine racemase [Candidatus Shapirobacteria bacterium]|nr:alanine racemase [Candidatus Shapirobacteria bacterium]
MRIYDSLNLIEISKDNLLFNFDYFSKFGRVWPVLKSNAYGHGIKQVVEILKERDFEYLVVDGYQEVLEIRKVTKRPVLMIGSILPSNFSKIKWKNLAIMVQDKESIRALGKLNKHIKIHLKVNTGMNRQGIDLDEMKKTIKLIKKYPKLEWEGMFSHLAGVDDEKQIKKFEEIKKITGEVKYFHLGATNGVGDIIRLGIGLYGIGKGLKPVLKLKSKIVKVRQIEKGEKVSYGGTFVTTKKTNIGVIPIGYFEGLDRRLSNKKGIVKYKNKFYQIAGRVCMNMVVVNFGKTKPKLYDEVELVGVEKMAKISETIPYDILVGINDSVRRTIV